MLISSFTLSQHESHTFNLGSDCLLDIDRPACARMLFCVAIFISITDETLLEDVPLNVVQVYAF